MPALDNLLVVSNVLGATNVLSDINDVTPQQTPPVFDPPAGTYAVAQSVTIAAAGVNTFHYTTNGSAPTTSSPLYSGPVLVAVTETLKAIAVNIDVRLRTSAVTSGLYTINAVVNRLGTAANFDLLASSTLTSVGATTVTGGDLGLSPGTSVTGFPPGTVVPPAVQHITDATAATAQVDLTTGYNFYSGLASTGALSADISGQTYTPGVYTNAAAVLLTVGNVTLDAQGDPNAIFVFQVGSALTFTAGTAVVLAGGAQAKNVYWQVGSSASFGANVVMVGSILAQASITFVAGASLTGRALARTAAITLDTNIITAP